ncbi:MAG: AAA family ATPase [bacterium]|nr:AAA family ATPase [bacterium]
MNTPAVIKPIYYMAIGAPGSGKTSAINRFGNLRVISPDSMIDENPELTREKAYDCACAEIKTALLNGENVFYDNTNAFPDRRRRMLLAGRPYARRVIGVWVDTPYEICVMRHKACNRERE